MELDLKAGLCCVGNNRCIESLGCQCTLYRLLKRLDFASSYQPVVVSDHEKVLNRDRGQQQVRGSEFNDQGGELVDKQLSYD